MGVESLTATPSTVEIANSCFSTLGKEKTLERRWEFNQVESVCQVEMQRVSPGWMSNSVKDWAVGSATGSKNGSED